MRTFALFAVVVLFSSSFLSSCNSDQDTKEKGAIDKHNEQVAQEAVQRIKAPMEQAKIAVDQENAHIKQMEDQAKSQ